MFDRGHWQLLDPLLDRALGLSAAELADWLDEVRSSAPDVANELDQLLAGEAMADEEGFLAEPLELRLRGLELGAYSLERPLGHGGMGSVWLARRTGERDAGHAAIKLLNLGLLTPAGRERFRREGSTLARLEHPGIARLLDAGVSRHGQPYLVIEYVDGHPIDTFADARRLDLTARLRLFLQVLDAVQHAHVNLVVHRDLKPRNILVTHDGTVKLLDFGIAKLLGAEDARRSQAESGRLLTPEFAAPEQASGESISPATDVYSLGALLYLLVSGRHPTAEGSRTPAEALRRLAEVDPRRLGLGDLDAILVKAMRRDARHRYQTAAAFAEDLQRYLRREPVRARRGMFAHRARQLLRRRRY